MHRNKVVFAVLCFAFSFAIFYPFITPDPIYDLDIFLNAANGNYDGFYYGEWILPFFKVLDIIPKPYVYSVGNVINMLCLLFAVHVFRGNKLLMFLTFPATAQMYFGQMDGLYLAALTGMFLVIKAGKSPIVVGLLWFISMAKFQIGIPLGIGLLWCYADWRTAVKAMGVVTMLWLASFLIWPGWLSDLIHRSEEIPLFTTASFDLWRYVGPTILILWLPLLFIRNYRMWVATWAMTLPYIQKYSLVALFIVPVGPIGWLAALPYVLSHKNVDYLMLIPASIYISCLWLQYREYRHEQSDTEISVSPPDQASHPV